MKKQLMKAAMLAMLATTSSLSIAQPANDAANTSTQVDTRDHHRGFDWGLLGLLGLLGLIPRKRRDVVIDNRTADPAR